MSTILITILTITSAITIAGFVAFFKLKRKVKNYSQSIFGTSSLNEIMRRAQLDEETTPKSVAGMEKLVLPTLIDDFPNLDINEMKKMAENSIIQVLRSIEKHQNLELKKTSEKVNNWLESKIDDVRNDSVSYDSLKIHRTVLNSYRKSQGICRVEFQTSLEYYYRKNSESSKRKQDRYRTEYIYIVDDEQASNNQSIALNCPNCGAPIKNLGQKHCNYCGTGVIDLVKKTWILNDIQQF